MATNSTRRQLTLAGSGSHVATPNRRRGVVRLSPRTPSNSARSSVTIESSDGIRHAVAFAVISTEVCVSALGSSAALGEWLGVARSQPGKWLSGQEHPSPRSERLVLDLAYVIERARQVWGHDAALRGWLAGSEPLLDGATPLDVVHGGDAPSVVKAIDGHLAGSYV